MREQVVRHILDFAQFGEGAFKVSGVPQDDGGDDQVEA